MQTSSEPRRCRECNRLVGKDTRRGLCRPCYRDPDVRDGYDPLPRGAWAGQGFGVRDAADKAKLIELFDVGFSDREIAARTGRSVAAVTKERQRLGLRVSKDREGASKARSWQRKKKR